MSMSHDFEPRGNFEPDSDQNPVLDIFLKRYLNTREKDENFYIKRHLVNNISLIETNLIKENKKLYKWFSPILSEHLESLYIRTNIEEFIIQELSNYPEELNPTQTRPATPTTLNGLENYITYPTPRMPRLDLPPTPTFTNIPPFFSPFGETNLVREANRRDSFHSSTGLSATVCQSLPVLDEYTIGGEKVEFTDNSFTKIDFMPEGRAYKDPAKITQSLSAGINGIAELVEAIDKGDKNLVPVFVGHTNINMALVAQRMGFEIVDSCRTLDGEIDRTKTLFTVVGRLSTIRDRVEQFQQTAKYQRLQARAATETTRRLTPALV